MRKLFVLALLALPLGLHAQAPRTFVSGLGVDTNPCSRTSPCRTFTAAMAAVAPGGEVFVLDSAGYGVFSIYTPVTIEVPNGVTAGVSVPASSTGLMIGLAAGDTAVIRGLLIDAAGGGSTGISIMSGGVISLEHVTVQNFGGGGGSGLCSSAGTAISASSLPFSAHVFLTDSTLTNNCHGIYVVGTSGSSASVVANRVQLQRNDNAFECYAHMTCELRDSVVTGADNLALHVEGNMDVEDSYISDTSSGLDSINGGIVYLSRSAFVRATNSVYHDGVSTVTSYGNNRFTQSGTPNISATVPLQ